MKSPFPGMDPFLDESWRDICATLHHEARNELNGILPHDLVARMHVSEEFQDDPVEPRIEREVHVLTLNERLITSVKFLSPANKRGKGIAAYRRDRQHLYDCGVHCVDIDLFRGGDGAESLWISRIDYPRGAVSPLRAVIRLANSDDFCLTPIRYQDRLPEVPIPLRISDRDAPIPLQRLLTRTYETGRYDQTLDYRADPAPPLGAEDARWAEELLRSAGLR